MTQYVKHPFEDNIWWEDDVLHVRLEDGTEWALKGARVVDHDWDVGGETMVEESVTLSYDSPIDIPHIKGVIREV